LNYGKKIYEYTLFIRCNEVYLLQNNGELWRIIISKEGDDEFKIKEKLNLSRVQT
jgi:hypothetical protein